MRAKTATTRLYVSVVTLLTAMVELTIEVVRLLTKLAVAGTEALARRKARQDSTLRPVRPYPPATRETGQRAYTGAMWQAAKPVQEQASEVDRLTTALVGLGFQAAPVRRYVTSVEGRIGKEPIETLIKDGLRALAS
jgi:hypothetical protein